MIFWNSLFLKAPLSRSAIAQRKLTTELKFAGGLMPLPFALLLRNIHSGRMPGLRTNLGSSRICRLCPVMRVSGVVAAEAACGGSIWHMHSVRTAGVLVKCIRNSAIHSSYCSTITAINFVIIMFCDFRSAAVRLNTNRSLFCSASSPAS